MKKSAKEEKLLVAVLFSSWILPHCRIARLLFMWFFLQGICAWSKCYSECFPCYFYIFFQITEYPWKQQRQIFLSTTLLSLPRRMFLMDILQNKLTRHHNFHFPPYSLYLFPSCSNPLDWYFFNSCVVFWSSEKMWYFFI